MTEPASDLFANVRPLTFRNLCAAGCGKEHSSTGKPPGILIPDIGTVCAECALAGAAKFINEHPPKLMSIPFYRREDS